MSHPIDPQLLRGGAVKVALIGCGGNGAQMLSGLSRLHCALLALGHESGLMINAFDDDLVSEANIGRQLFYPCDVGQNKAQVLVHRLNVGMGLNWQAVSERCDEKLGQALVRAGYDIVITCVDTARARRDVHYLLQGPLDRVAYWLDLGNSATHGQVVLGQPHAAKRTMMGVPAADVRALSADMAISEENARLAKLRLPTITDLFPEILDKKFKEEDLPSCSLLQALQKQDLFINQSVATWGLQLLWTLFRRGAIEHHGYYINLDSGRVNPLPVPTLSEEAPLQYLQGAKRRIKNSGGKPLNGGPLNGERQ